MAHAQIIVAVDQPTEVTAFKTWLAANESRLTYISDKTGCGCCVDIYDVEGPEEVLRTIPPAILATSRANSMCDRLTDS